MGAIVGSKFLVYTGKADKTEHGYTKKDIVRRRQKDGSFRYVWKSKSEQAKKQYRKNPKVRQALKKQQEELKNKMKKKRTSTKKKTSTKKTSFWKKLF